MASKGAAPAAGSSFSAEKVLQLMQNASREIRDLDVGRSVDRLPLAALTPLRFATEYVQRNKPLVITGAIDGWPAMRLWGERYLANHPVAGETVVTVDVTPNGRGDAVTHVVESSSGAPARWFVTPHERRMTLREFFNLMGDTRARDRQAAVSAAAAAADSEEAAAPREVPYLQHQNSNLTEELGQLLADIGPGLPWAEEVFGGPPEAVNIWIGDERSATSFHKDHYENLYAVLRGTKVFTLLPPTDVYRMHLLRCPAAAYVLRREVPPGGSYGEVSPLPGGTPGAAGCRGTGGAGQQGEWAEEQEGSDGGRLVAVLQDPGYAVLWSAVDTTSEGHAADPGMRAAQPLFYGRQEDGRSAGGDSGRAQEEDEEEEEDEGNNGSDGSSSGRRDPWDGAGGAPLVVEVGPGEVLYLPSIWYHQVEQRTDSPVLGPGRRTQQQPPGEEAAAAVATVADGRAAEMETAGEGTKEDEEEEEEYVIAVNFWYDMKYDSRYATFKLVEGLATALGLAEEPPLRESGY